MQTRLDQIQLYEKKGAPPRVVSEAHILEGHGLKGDRHCMGEARQISITSREILAWMDGQSAAGLCFQKFSANLILDDLKALCKGDLIRIGEDALLRVTDTHKTCFQEECQLFASGGACRLTKGVLFAEGAASGQIHTGDPVRAIKERKEMRG